ncbi:hypothetical protein ACVMHR_005455 [Bradyrhizobium diazoefficiens]
MKHTCRNWCFGAAIIAVAAIGSVQWSHERGPSFSVDSPQARVSTPASVAGVARRTTRRAVVGGAVAAGAAATVVAPACARVLVNGVWVCR